MIKVASIILLIAVSIAVGEDLVLENERGCPLDSKVYKILPHGNCNRFYICASGEPIPLTCPDGLLYNVLTEVCDWPSNVDCGNRNNNPSDSYEKPDDPVATCATGETNGLLIAHEYCNHFYMCVRGTPIDVTCPEPLLFDTNLKICDWESYVECKDRLRVKEPQEDLEDIEDKEDKDVKEDQEDNEAKEDNEDNVVKEDVEDKEAKEDKEDKDVKEDKEDDKDKDAKEDNVDNDDKK